MYITLKLARRLHACDDGYNTVANALGGVDAYGDDTPIPLSVVLQHAGIGNTFWCIRRLNPSADQQRDLRLFAADDRPRKSIKAARDYAERKMDRTAAAAAAAAADAADAAAAAAAAAADDAERQWQTEKLKALLLQWES